MIVDRDSKKRKAAHKAVLPDVSFLVDCLLPGDQARMRFKWETEPQLLPTPSQQSKLLQSLFNTDSFRKLLKKHDNAEPLQFGRDLNAARFVDGARETPNAHVHQPQRWQGSLASLCALMEQRLGCLVGINAYLTPPNTQGLAPHHDDVEIFVCQTEGCKRWRLYKPHRGFALPNQPSGDLKEEDLGAPVMDVTLKIGDILYMPRGTVHQAVAQDEASTHLTISTYQGFSYGVLGQALLQTALQGQEQPLCLPLGMRKGLPWGFLYHHGFQADLRNNQAAQEGTTKKRQQPGADGKSVAKSGVAYQLAAGLRELADRVESEPELLSRAADLMSLDFMTARAPPSEASLLPLGKEPSLQDAVQCRASTAFRLVQFETGAADMPGAMVKVVSSLANPIEEHMMGEEDEHDHPNACCSHANDHDHDHGHHANSKAHGQQANKGTALSVSDESADDASDDANNEGETDAGDGDESDDDEDGSADLVFPAEYGPALVELLSDGQTRVKDIRLPNDELRLDLAVTLWKEGIVCAKALDNPKPAKKSRK